MGDSEFTYRVIKKNEIPDALDIWKETGMHEGTHCLYTWFEVDPEGIRVAVTKEGEIVGVCAATIIHDGLAFVGIYAVRSQYRGHGVGMKLWQECVDHFGSRNGAVNAVPGKLELYRDRGRFPILETSWVSVVYETHENVDPSVLLKEVIDVEIRPIDSTILDLVVDYDGNLFGYKKGKVLSLSIAENKSVSFAAIQDSKCVGYGILKTSIQGHGLVGPLYCDNKDIAEALLRRLIESLPDVKGFVINLVSNNLDAKLIVEKLGVPMLEECDRLYTKRKLDVDYSKIFGEFDLNFFPF